MNTIRAFIAVEISDPIKQKISGLISCLAETESGAKWVAENQMHLTIKFLGNINKEKVQDISGLLSDISDTFKSFKITFSEIGAFPDINHSRVIWLGIDKGMESLKELNNKLETELEKSGFKKEDREFSPHITLARTKSYKNISNLIKLTEEKNLIYKNEVLITRVTLFQSSLGSKGAVHIPILQKTLQNI